MATMDLLRNPLHFEDIRTIYSDILSDPIDRNRLNTPCIVPVIVDHPNDNARDLVFMR